MFKSTAAAVAEFDRVMIGTDGQRHRFVQYRDLIDVTEGGDKFRRWAAAGRQHYEIDGAGVSESEFYALRDVQESLGKT
jgi:hypothetical protein